MPMDEYPAHLRELETDVSALEPLGVTVIEVEPVSVREIHWSPTDLAREDLER
ncbi:hypothetical protein ACWEOI_30695 [Nocardia sp. NPDC004340]